ncbi:uncharacterized protein PF3D7_1120000-like [Anolis sagrei]|uniref:uncharacterized protein PF3D7_1120000-like n=1 Tax=Anolis sagrei TaxID=38937 RepID=UPI00351FAB75
MMTPKAKVEKTDKDNREVKDPKEAKENKENKGQTKKGSTTEDSINKEILREILKIAEKQNELKEDLKRIETKQETQQKNLQEEIQLLRKDLTSEVGTLKEEMNNMAIDIKKIKDDKIKTEKAHIELDQKIKKLELEITKTKDLQERLEMKDLESQLRFRNIIEEPNEDIRQIIIALTATMLNKEQRDLDLEIDKTYRITTNFSKKNKTPRDTIVLFSKKRTRDEILRINSNTPPIYKDNKVIIMKEFPQSIIAKRRKYFFLSDELKKANIKFRWEKPEGLMVSYKEQKHWLTNEEKARDFYDHYMKDQGKSPRDQRLLGGKQLKRPLGSPDKDRLHEPKAKESKTKSLNNENE